MAKSSLELSSSPSINLGNPAWNAASTSVAFDNAVLATSTLYTLTLKAKDVSGNALAETTIVFTTSDTADTTVPSTPTGLIATPADGQVTLTWKANAEADVAGYTVYMGTAANALKPRDVVTTNSKTLTGLTNGTTYFFAVDAVDTANNHSSQTALVSATPSPTITDTTPPTIQSSDPADGATNVPPRNPMVKLVFSEPMDKASFAFTFNPPFVAPDGNPDELLETIWSENDTVATIRPSESEVLPETTVFTLTLTTAKDKAGNDLSGDKELTFTTGEEAPRLISSTPANGAINIPAEEFNIRLAFSKPMDTTTFALTVGVQPELGFGYDYNNSLEFVWSQDDRVLTLTSSSHLNKFAEDTTYTLTLIAKSKTGKALADSTVTFKTVEDIMSPRILDTRPLDGESSQPLSRDIIIHFDDLMDETTTLAALSSSPALPCTWREAYLQGIIVMPLTSSFLCEATGLEANTTYTITVSTEAKDTSGNNLFVGKCIRDPNDPPCAYTFSFTTLNPPPLRGNLQLDISGLPLGEKRVQVTGPDGFDSGLLDENTSFSGVLTGDYTVTATGFTVAPGKPACRIYTPTPESQTATVTANQTTTATVTYDSVSCAPPKF
jgi:hypothetical protein